MGMTPEECTNLFQKFVRGQEQKKSHTEGLGLGLYVAKLIAQAHGGDLFATSVGKGKGSTFHLVLPIIQPTSPATTKSTEPLKNI
ncbi:MAG: ATP-binding protein [Patescibacteria group bacterium]